MKITNKYNLPQTLINLHDRQRAEYIQTREVGGIKADVSVTQIIRSPRIDLLRAQHWAEMEEDISDRLWAILGTVIHKVMVDGADEEHIAEENLLLEIGGVILKGGIDVQRLTGNHVKIIDYKFTKAFKYQKGEFEDWETQLNCYAYLVHKVKGYIVDEIEVVMFVRDFMASLAKTDKAYPQASAVPVSIKLWTIEEQRTYIERQIHHHQEAQRAVDWGEEIPPCTDEDRWLRPGDFALMKPGAKRAYKTFKTEEEANAALLGAMKWAVRKPDAKTAYKTAPNEVEAEALRQAANKPENYIIEELQEYTVVQRQPPPARCAGLEPRGYCGVAQWCSQWQSEKEKWNINDD